MIVTPIEVAAVFPLLVFAASFGFAVLLAWAVLVERGPR